VTIGAKHRPAIRAHLGHAHFDQAHPAITRGSQFLVITIARHITPGLLTRFDQRVPFGNCRQTPSTWTLTNCGAGADGEAGMMNQESRKEGKSEHDFIVANLKVALDRSA
jgi:hypothetical protein